MERTVVDCDRCKKPNSVLPSGRLNVATHRGLDAAGSNSTDYTRVDLCPDCVAARLRTFLDTLGYDEGRAWVRETTNG